MVNWLLELRIGAVYPVLDPEPAVAGVELEVVEVVELGGEGEREVVAGVVVHHLQTADRVEYSNMFRLNLVKNINFGLDQKKIFFDTLKNCILGQ